jgi:hypothetical protein
MQAAGAQAGCCGCLLPDCHEGSNFALSCPLLTLPLSDPAATPHAHAADGSPDQCRRGPGLPRRGAGAKTHRQAAAADGAALDAAAAAATVIARAAGIRD